MKKPVRKGYAQGGQVDAADDYPKTVVSKDRLPNMTRPDPGWVPKELPKATPFGGFGRAYMGKPMAKGGKVKLKKARR